VTLLTKKRGGGRKALESREEGGGMSGKEGKKGACSLSGDAGRLFQKIPPKGKEVAGGRKR